MAESLENRLSRIDTEWSMLRMAHASEAGAARPAQEKLLLRYGGAVRRYLLGCLRDADAAEEVFQEFALRLLKGNLQGATPERGRFRHFLKAVLSNLVADYHQKRKRLPQRYDTEMPEPADGARGPASDADFFVSWREELLAQAWRGLEEEEKATRQPFFTVLAHRRDHPDERSEAMAQALSKLLGKPLTAAGVRQTLHRARERFADVLLDQVIHSLDQATEDDLRAELTELQLMHYCEPALQRRHGEE